MDDHQQLLERSAALEREVAELRQAVAERDAGIAELEEELRRRDKNYRPKPIPRRGRSRPIAAKKAAAATATRWVEV